VLTVAVVHTHSMTDLAMKAEAALREQKACAVTRSKLREDPTYIRLYRQARWRELRPFLRRRGHAYRKQIATGRQVVGPSPCTYARGVWSSLQATRAELGAADDLWRERADPDLAVPILDPVTLLLDGARRNYRDMVRSQCWREAEKA